MKIRFRIWLLIGLSLVSLLIVGGLSIRSAFSNIDNQTLLASDAQKVSNAIYIRNYLNNYMRRFYSSALFGNLPYEAERKELERALGLMQSTSKELVRYYNEIDPKPKRPEAQAIWDKLNTHWNGWNAALVDDMQKKLGETLNNPSKEAFDRYRQQHYETNLKFRDVTTEMGNVLSEYIDLIQKLLDEEMQRGIADSKTDVTLHSGILILAFVASLGLGLTTLAAIMKPIELARNTMVTVERDNDLTLKVDYASTNEMGELVGAFNSMLEKLKTVFKSIQSGIMEVHEAVVSMSSAAKQVASSSEHQSNATSAMAASVEEMTVTINTVAASAGDAQTQAQQAGEVSEEGGRIINQTAEEMSGIAATVADASTVITALGEESKQISSVVQVIKEVADQTNLLALNAAIEAARAGEQGRGFAVVADEVRKLAERTAQSTGDISSMIGKIQTSANDAVAEMSKVVKQVESGQALAQQAGKHMLSIREQSENVSGSVTEISSALKEQSQASQEIARHVEGIAQMTDENSAAASETASSAQIVDQIAAKLSKAVAQFKV